MWLDEEPLAGGGEVHDQILLCFLVRLVQNAQLLRQLHRDTLGQRIDAVHDDRQSTSKHEPLWEEL